MKQPPRVTPPVVTPPVVTPPAVSPNQALADRHNAITAYRDRLRKVCLSLRQQTTNPRVYDDMLSCITPISAVDGRLPVTVQRVITVDNKHNLVLNHLARAVLAWGTYARAGGEGTYDTADLDLLEKVAAKGVKYYGAYPKDRNSIIHVLRTVGEEREVRVARHAASERALALKFPEKVDNGEDKAEGDVGGRVGEVGGAASQPVQPGAGEEDPEVQAP